MSSKLRQLRDTQGHTHDITRTDNIWNKNLKVTTGCHKQKFGPRCLPRYYETTLKFHNAKTNIIRKNHIMVEDGINLHRDRKLYLSCYNNTIPRNLPFSNPTAKVLLAPPPSLSTLRHWIPVIPNNNVRRRKKLAKTRRKWKFNNHSKTRKRIKRKWRERIIHFCWIEEVDSGMEGFIKKTKGLRQRVLLTKCHCSWEVGTSFGVAFIGIGITLRWEI